MSITPTAGSATAARSGRCVSTAPISSPPFEPPRIASFFDDVYFCEIKYSALAMKSSNTFCFFASIPASCHARPYSPPPRITATAKTPPIDTHCNINGENAGVM